MLTEHGAVDDHLNRRWRREPLTTARRLSRTAALSCSHSYFADLDGAERLSLRVDVSGRSRIQTTLDLYSDTDLESMIEAQDRYVDAVGV